MEVTCGLDQKNKRKDPPPPHFNPKSPDHKPNKLKNQPPSDPKPSDPRNSQKIKVLDSKFELEFEPTPKGPTIKIKHPQSTPS